MPGISYQLLTDIRLNTRNAVLTTALAKMSPEAVSHQFNKLSLVHKDCSIKRGDE
jgi:hypothetical protein